MRSTVRGLLALAQSWGLDRLDAQVLLLHALGRDTHDRAWLLAHDSDEVPPDAALRSETLFTRRRAGEPVAYLTGWREFHGLRLQVDARVLDPRPDTETLVDWALSVLESKRQPRVLDLGTGSGAIALAIQHGRPDADVWAVDASPEALAVAQANAQRLGLAVHFRHGRWMENWVPTSIDDAQPPDRFDLVVSNPPYLANDDPHLTGLTHEPAMALVSGTEGLEDLRTIVQQAPSRLTPGGWLLLEHGWDQGPAVSALLHAAGLHPVEVRHDLAGHWRCSGGRQTTGDTGPLAPSTADTRRLAG